MGKCESCNRILPAGHTEDSPCPSCGALPTQHGRGTPTVDTTSDIDTGEMTPFEGVDEGLYLSIKQIAKEGAWHLAAMAEILAYHLRHMSESLNDARPVANRMVNFSIQSKRVSVIQSDFDEFLTTLADLHTLFARDLASDRPTPSMMTLREFYEQTGASIGRLLNFHASVGRLRFVRDSTEHRLQTMMMDWVHHELVCLEELRKQLNRKSIYEPEQLKERSVQVTLSPPNLTSFFELFDRLHTPSEGLE